MRDCKLEGLPDLNLQSEYVRTKIAEYLNRLIDIGVAGFRIGYSKHMWPAELLYLYRMLNDTRSE